MCALGRSDFGISCRHDAGADEAVCYNCNVLLRCRIVPPPARLIGRIALVLIENVCFLNDQLFPFFAPLPSSPG